MPRRKCISKDDRTSKVDYSSHKMLLDEWMKVANVCIEDLKAVDYRSCYADETGNLRAYPQIDVLRKATGEIRQLVKAINDHGTKEDKVPDETNALADVLKLYDGKDKKAK